MPEHQCMTTRLKAFSTACTARGCWDTGLKPTLLEHSVEGAAGDIQPG